MTSEQLSQTLDVVKANWAVVAFFLAWIWTLFAWRRDANLQRKSGIGRALSILLEERHRIVGIELVINHLQSHLKMPAGAALTLRTLIDQVFPHDDELEKKYDNAIDELSKHDPVLAFEFRSKNRIPDVLSKMRAYAKDGGVSSQIVETVEVQMAEHIIPNLDKAVLELAKLHGFGTQKQVRSLLRKSPGLPPNADLILSQMRDTFGLFEPK